MFNKYTHLISKVCERKCMQGSSYKAVIALFMATYMASAARAGTLPVPNGSFESPATDFASPAMDAWQKSSQPVWYADPTFPWDQLIGQFANPTNGSPDRISNMEGNQGAFLFALPDVAIYQDTSTLSSNSAAPSQLNAQFEVGKSYSLTVGILGGGGGMTNGATLEIALYFRDVAGKMVTAGSTTITNSSLLFPTKTYFTDFQVRIPFVKAADAWAGKKIGIKIASTVGFDKMGGYWDIDNVRLTESVVPNGSFEDPETDFASPFLDAWEKAPQPVWYNDPQFPWHQLAGQFRNATNGSPDHISNMDGNQGAFLFSLPGVAIYQDYLSSAGTNAMPTSDSNLKYEPGKAYMLTVGLLGGGGGMSNGATFEISFYYRDSASNKITVAATTITNSVSLFSTRTLFTDFSVQVPIIRGDEPYANRNIGIQLASTTGFDKMGGYWDIDNVRLQVVRRPALTNPMFKNRQFQFVLESVPGQYEVLSSANLLLPIGQWTSLGTFKITGDRVVVTDTNAIADRRFYFVRSLH